MSAANTNESDSLEIRMGVNHGAAQRTLIVDFGKPITFVEFTKEDGMKFAEQFLERLKTL